MEHAKRSEELLKKAIECELISRLANTDENKHAYLKMAELYRALAEQESKLKGSGLPVVDGD
jgi:hypothetical protein